MSSAEKEPWAIFADEDEPWKDRERLFRLLDKMDTQAEVGDALGCDSSTVSYWKRKFEDEVRDELADEKTECEYFDTCGNYVVGGHGQTCDLCLELARRADRDRLAWETDDRFERMERLYSEYSQRVTEFVQHPVEDEDDAAPECGDCEEAMVEVGEIEAHICTECGATA